MENFQSGVKISKAKQYIPQYLTVNNAPPTNHPVTVDEAKLFCKVDTATDNDIFDMLIHAATKEIENETGGYCIIKRSITQKQTGGLEVLELMREPVASITSVTYAQGFSDTPTTITSDVRLSGANLFHEDGYFKQGRNGDGYVVTFVAGSIDDTNQAHLSTPSLLKNAILRLVAYYYENRQEHAKQYSEGNWSVSYGPMPEDVKRMVMYYHTSKGLI